MKTQLDHAYLLSILNYDPETGVFIWKKKISKKVIPGTAAGSLKSEGYFRIGINGCEYHSHRLAWFYVHGNWPEGQIDHIDRNPSNNAISNLRDVNQSINNRNQALRQDNKSGYKGVRYDIKARRWIARITIEGKCISLGSFIDKKFAIKARQDAERKYGILNEY